MIFEEGRETENIFCVPSCPWSNRHVCSHRIYRSELLLLLLLLLLLRLLLLLPDDPEGW